jgi:predicted ATPase/transcriptional regulator with XRE-family HTH domain
MTVASSFGQWLKQRRKAHDLTQERLAEQVGCSAEMIRKIEAGARRPSRETAERMAHFLAVAPDELTAFVQLARKAQPAPSEPGRGATQPQPDADARRGATQPQPDAEARPAASAPGPERPAPPFVVPAPPTPLIGRERLVAGAEALLRRDAVRLLTLTGPGGTGKTRVGLQLARNLAGAFADGTYFVALAAISDPEQVVPAIAQTLGVREEGGRPVLESLRAHLQERHALLVLDNFEQLLDAAPAVGRLLAACPRLKLLTTSRVRLQLYGEYELAVPPLELPACPDGPADDPERVGALLASEAVRLFLARAEAVRPAPGLMPDDLATIAAICARLDGLPLAIELAAARSKFFSPRALLAQLSSRLNTLVGGPCDLPARQRTLRDAIGWSFKLLNLEEQAVFAALGCFVGGFTMEAAAGVCAGLPAAPGALPVAEIVTALVDKSLLRQEAGAAGGQRFSMLETIREYALEQLALRGMAEAQQRRHAAYFLTLAEAAEPQLWSPQRQAAMDELELEYGNIRATLAWSEGPSGDPETALRMASALWWFWFMRSSMSEGQLWLTGALEQRARTSAEAQAKALPRAGIQAWFASDYARAEALCAEGVELNRRLGDRIGVAYGVHGLGLVALDRCEPRALAYFEECLGHFREEQHIWGVAWSLFRLAQSAWVQGVQGAAWALPLLEESHGLFQLVGDNVGVAHALYSLGAVARGQGDLARSRRRYEEGLELCRAQGDKGTLIYALQGLGQVALDQGELGRAEALFVESLRLCGELREQRGFAAGMEGLAGVALAAGLLERSTRLCGAAAAWREQICYPLTPLVRADYERTLEAARLRLSPWAFETAWAAGRGAPIEQSLTYALQQSSLAR